MTDRRVSGVKIRILIGDAVAIGPGKARLLEAIGRTGSIAGAAREMEMSYGRAWQLVRAMNGDFVEPLVRRETGGRGGGGAVVTPLGHEALDRYRAIERTAGDAVADLAEAFDTLLKKRQ